MHEQYKIKMYLIITEQFSLAVSGYLEGFNLGIVKVVSSAHTIHTDQPIRAHSCALK